MRAHFNEIFKGLHDVIQPLFDPPGSDDIGAGFELFVLQLTYCVTWGKVINLPEAGFPGLHYRGIQWTFLRALF